MECLTEAESTESQEEEVERLDIRLYKGAVGWGLDQGALLGSRGVRVKGTAGGQGTSGGLGALGWLPFASDANCTRG